jgi:hypothetical protein
MDQDMAISISRPEKPIEATDLERRVLAHERVLQALIAYMSRAEPRFVDHLRERFIEPMMHVGNEQDYRDSDYYAAEFIRAVIRLGDERMPSRCGSGTETGPAWVGQHGPSEDSGRRGRDERVQVRERHGIWAVTLDGAFYGDYHQEVHASAAAALLKLSLR